MTNIVRDILLDLPSVSNIIIHKDNYIRRRTYQCAFNCNLLVREKEVAVIICVPENWEQELIHIYVDNIYSLPFMPHIEKDGKLCLFDLEGVLIEPNLSGIITQCVERAINILYSGLYENTDEEFVREFSSYWSYLPNLINMKISIPTRKESQILKYLWKVPKRKKQEKYSQYVQRCKNTCIYAGTSTYFQMQRLKGQQKNSLFCYIQATNFVIPPDFREPLSINYCNKLLSMMYPLKRTSDVKKGCKSQLLIFDIIQPNGAETCIAIFLKKGRLALTGDGRFEILTDKGNSVFPVYTVREDKAFIIKRTDGNQYNNKKILLIGCGSIGSYMCNELVKAGIENITVVDTDLLKAENIYRHFLGMEYVGQYKADALCRYFSKNIPNINMKAIDGDIRELIREEEIDLPEYDLIISAIGNHNINRWIDNEIRNRKIDTAVIYEWNEPLDIGCHVAVISGGNSECYECFFKRNEMTGNLYDAVAYTAPDQRVSRNLSGCGGSYIPYGSSVSLKTVGVGMDLVRRVLDNRCDDNYLISVKGEGYYFIQAGLKVSNFYLQQKNEISIQRLSELTEGKN
ncbi:MAG: ThiF family adenylyltransferase [Mediterraneibacter sp.]